MTTKINILKEKYPHHKIKYDPQLDCRACNGTGEHLNGYREMTLCICTCVDFGDIGGIFGDFVQKELGELRKSQ